MQGKPPRINQHQMPHPGGVLYGISTGQICSQAVPQKDEFLHANYLSPLLDGVDELVFSESGIWGERDACASTKPRQIYGKKFSIRVEVVEILVELEKSSTKSVYHDNWDCLLRSF